MKQISSFYLFNNGGFACNTGCTYIDDDGNICNGSSGGHISLGTGEAYNPGDHGVAAGTTVRLAIGITAGNDRTGGQYFEYQPTAPGQAHYEITGTTLNSDVHFQGVQMP